MINGSRRIELTVVVTDIVAWTRVNLSLKDSPVNDHT